MTSRSDRRTAMFSALCGAAMIAATSASAQETITIATEGAYAPWNFVNAQGQLEGFEIDLAEELCTRAELECEIVSQDWDGIIPSLVAKKYDAIMAGMNITPTRKETIDFTQPYAGGPHGFMVMDDSDLVELPKGEYSLTVDEAGTEAAIEELKPMFDGKIIGVQGSTTNSNFAEKYFADVAEIRLYKTTEQHDLDLAAGRIDAALAAHSAFKATIDGPSGDGMVVVGPAFSGGLLGLGVAVGLRQEDTELRDKLDAAITSAKEDGVIEELSMKWFGIDMTPKS
ncbi:MAG: transporter substrate-binding domain-containing protein [Pseudomonadota bacterium]